jgi:hypothetical protein
MRPFGRKQLEFLGRMAGYGRAVVVGDALIRSLAARGAMRPLGGNAFYVITADGLRAVADAMDAGAIPAITIDDFKPEAT